MLIIPAVDIKGGRCVRLLQGRMDDETVYSDAPLEMALNWESGGAGWLHIVDLDGAIKGRGVNDDAVKDIVDNVGMKTELGGGVRDMARIEALLGMGVTRVILGTVAAENPGLVDEAVKRFGPKKVIVGIDARDGIVATRGWTEKGWKPAFELGREMRDLGIERIIYTDISRDGMLTGPNVLETGRMAEETGLLITASGGVSSVEDIRSLKPIEESGVDSVIVGKALYEGKFTLREAIASGKK